jgi:hypothetical protein
MTAHGRAGQMGRRFAILIGVAAAGVLGVGVVAVPALADQTVKIDSRVILLPDHNEFCHQGQCSRVAYYGQVKSSKHACEVHRTVKVFRAHSGPDVLVGKDSSDRHGKTKVVARVHPGFYYMKVLRREVRAAGTICRGDRTETIDGH